MKSEAILRTSLLDIIFENRNKEYGAYVLRKESDKRLFASLFGMLGLVLVFCLLQQFIKGNHAVIMTPYVIDPHPMNPPGQLKAVEPVVHHSTPLIANSREYPPVIVNTIPLVNDPVPDPPTESALNGSGVPGSPGEGVSGTGKVGNDSGKVAIPELTKPEVDRTIPVDHPDVAPEYPGGINALLKFLKSNLQSPGDLENEVQVKVRFVVNYDGSLLRFDVLQSGGNEFDKEVLRVLKKMPKWVPGKSNGENVSVYFVVPVKFTPVE